MLGDSLAFGAKILEAEHGTNVVTFSCEPTARDVPPVCPAPPQIELVSDGITAPPGVRPANLRAARPYIPPSAESQEASGVDRRQGDRCVKRIVRAATPRPATPTKRVIVDVAEHIACGLLAPENALGI